MKEWRILNIQKKNELPKSKTCEYSDGKKCKITEWDLEDCHCNSCISYEEKYIKEQKGKKDVRKYWIQ